MLGGAAAVLSPELAAFERRTGHQMVVAAFQSLDGESLEDYSNRLFKAWKIGSAKSDDGVLFALFVQDRKWRVEVGYGLEPLLTDLEAAEIARGGVPQFRAGDYGGGTVAVIRGLETRLTGGPRMGGEPPRPAPGRPYTRDEWELLIAFGLAPGLMFVLLLIIGRNAGSGVGRRYTGWKDGGWGGGGFGGGGGGWGGGFGGGGGFSGGGGSSGGGGASGGW